MTPVLVYAEGQLFDAAICSTNPQFRAHVNQLRVPRYEVVECSLDWLFENFNPDDPCACASLEEWAAAYGQFFWGWASRFPGVRR